MVTGRSVFDCSLRHLATGHGEAVPILLIEAWPARVVSFTLSPGAKKTSKGILSEEVFYWSRAITTYSGKRTAPVFASSATPGIPPGQTGFNGMTMKRNVRLGRTP